MKHIWNLWGEKEVILKTVLDNTETILSMDSKGFSKKSI